MAKSFHVYKGLKNGVVVYIGTTIQKPTDRWRWHKHNGKDLDFFLVDSFDNKEQMLEKEFELIKQYKPRLNKIKNRKQNLNKKLDNQELNSRKNCSQWCQSCLKRRVNSGYKICYFCERH